MRLATPTRWLASAPQKLDQHHFFLLALVALLAAYLGLGVYFVLFGRINQDEGWYLYAARLVYRGDLPYHDFAFFQPPLVPYVYGIPQRLFGESLEVGRFTSLFLSLVTVTLGMRLSYERAGRFAALIFGAAILLTPLMLWTFTTTRTEPLSAFLIMVSAFLLLREPPRPLASAGALTAAVLAAATRVTSVPVAALILIWLLYRHRNMGRRLVLVLLPGTVVAVATLSLVVANFEAAWFNIVTVQAERHNQFQPAQPWDIVDYLRARADNILALRRSFGFVPVLGLAGVGAAIAILLEQRKQSAIAPLTTAVAGLAALAVAMYVPNLLPRTVHPEYFVPVFPLLLALIAISAGELFRRASPSGRRAIVAAIVGLLLFQATGFVSQLSVYTMRSDPDLRELRTIADYLSDVVPEDGTLLTMDTYLAVESGLAVAPGWEMSIFSYFPRRPADDGPRFRVVTASGLAASLLDEAVDAVVLSDLALGLLVERRATGYRRSQLLTEQELRAALPELSGYRLDRVFPSFGQHRDNLYVLLRDRR